jgi:hypothetical protein
MARHITFENNKRGRVTGGAELFTLNRDDALYCAGLFDGEGSISIVVNSNGSAVQKAQGTYRHHRLVVRVASTSRDIVEWLALKCGGTAYPRRLQKARYSPAWSWGLWDGRAEHFLRQLRPFLKLKGPQADLAFELRATKGRGRPRGNSAALVRLFRDREQMRVKMRALNKRGQVA